MALRPDDVKRPTNLRVRRFIAKYVTYLEVLGYLFVVLIAATIAALWLIKVDDISKGATSGPTPLIKPLEEPVSWPSECAVVELLVEDEIADEEPVEEEATAADSDEDDETDKRRDVDKGEPLLRLTDDPAAIQKFKDAEKWQKVVDDIEAAEDLGNLSATMVAAKAEAEAKLAAWDEEKANLPTKTIRAPISGMLKGAKKADVEDKVYAADAKILTVVDFTDLRISVKCTGANVLHGRLLQQAKVRIKDTYGSGEIVRVDLKEPGRFRKRRVEFLDVTDGKAKQALTEFLQDKTLSVKKDVGFELNNISKIEVLSGQESEVLDELPADESARVDAEAFHDKEYTATMIAGYHHLKVSWTKLDPDLKAELAELIEAEITGKSTEVVDADTDERLRFKLGKLRRPKFILEMILRQPHVGDEITKDIAKRIKREGAIIADQRERFYQGTLRLNDPPQVLRDTVRKLYLLDTPKYLDTEVEWVVDKRRIAMLLFRQ